MRINLWILLCRYKVRSCNMIFIVQKEFIILEICTSSVIMRIDNSFFAIKHNNMFYTFYLFSARKVWFKTYCSSSCFNIMWNFHCSFQTDINKSNIPFHVHYLSKLYRQNFYSYFVNMWQKGELGCALDCEELWRCGLCGAFFSCWYKK